LLRNLTGQRLRVFSDRIYRIKTIFSPARPADRKVLFDGGGEKIIKLKYILSIL
jgi:hypothetical protein